MGEKVKIVEKIKALRLSLNLSQGRFGKKFGVSGKTVSAYETGKCTPPLKILEKISQTYDTGFVAMSSIRNEDLKKKINYLKEIISEIEEKLVT